MGAMAVAASGLDPEQVFEKYLYTPLGMNETTWTPKKNPQFATGITTTGSDFEKMLKGLSTYDFLGKKILDEMEKDWSAPPVSPSGDGWFDTIQWVIGSSAWIILGASALDPLQLCQNFVS